jgi:lipopolysaccharide transport system permease protein
MTPVAYSVSLVPPSPRLIYCLNPMTGVIDAWRFFLFGGRVNFSLAEFAISCGTTGILLLAGLWFFRSHEPTLADVGEV